MLFPPYPALLLKPAGTIKVDLPADRKDVLFNVEGKP